MNSRRKGKEGELQVVHIAEAAGLPCRRSGDTGQAGGDLAFEVDHVYVESRWRKQLRVREWLREVAGKAGDKLPVLAFRENRMPWYAAVPLADLFRLIAFQRQARSLLREVMARADHGTITMPEVWRDEVRELLD